MRVRSLSFGCQAGRVYEPAPDSDLIRRDHISAYRAGDDDDLSRGCYMGIE
jgi:hypothetical protein